MSRIVCNSGPLIALGLLDRLDLLQALFAEILIPDAVRLELEQGGASQRGLLDALAPCFHRLRQEGYWVHDSIVQAALKETREGG